MSGQHFRDYHLLLDEHATQIFSITDAIAERVRKVGGITINSIGHITRLQRIAYSDEEFVGPTEMLRELNADNKAFVESLRAAHVVTSKANEDATTSLIEIWIDEAERRAGLWMVRMPMEFSRVKSRSGSSKCMGEFSAAEADSVAGSTIAQIQAGVR